MLHDERQYPEPDIFNPDRFLDSNQPDPALYVFGFGRRACPGSHLAQASMFLSIAQTLALFNIKRARDQSDREVVPSAEWITGTIRYAPFLRPTKQLFDKPQATQSISYAISRLGQGLHST
jgi:hypothetical protein